ncbi:MAG: hypothetical protein COC23_05185 [Hyphomicrobiales bacterium]|nr:MAG: hypothetical protein COC23_05185 [Hyphomicrobiales bacterium]
MSDDLQLRVDKLEELCAHQSAEIDTLSDTMREQWTRIEELTKVMEMNEGFQTHLIELRKRIDPCY